MKKTQRELAEQLKSMHTKDSFFLLPNAWDVASAMMFEQAGAHAIGTSSAGFSYTLGLPDGEKLGIEDQLFMLDKTCQRTQVAVTADVEAGYSDCLEDLIYNIRRVIDTGIAGINLEDGTSHPTPALTEMHIQKQHIAAIRALANNIGIPLVINARTDIYWLNIGDENQRLPQAISRANHYLEAGADCAFVPGMLDYRTITTLCQEITGPVNVLLTPKCANLDKLKQCGVNRVSTGSAPARANLGYIKYLTSQICNSEFENLFEGAISYADANTFFAH